MQEIHILRSNQIPFESNATLGDEIIPRTKSYDNWNLDDAEPFKPRVKRRYCCGCFRSRSGCLSVCISVWFAVIVLLGIGVFLVYPRIPTIEIGKPYTPEVSTGLTYNSTNGKLDTITFPVVIDFSVESANYIDIFCSEIAVNGNLLNGNKEVITNAFGIGALKQVSFPSHKKVTSLGVTIRQDPALSTLFDNVLSENLGILSLQYRIKVTIPLISWTGFTFNKQDIMSFDLSQLSSQDSNFLIEIVRRVFSSISSANN